MRASVPRGVGLALLAMRRLAPAALAVAAVAIVPASASAAGGFLPPRNLERATASDQQYVADFNAGGAALFAIETDLGGGKRAIAVDLRHRGGPIKRQVLPVGGTTQIGKSASFSADLSPKGRGVVAWTQGDAIHYALRVPGRPFGTARAVQVPPAATAHLFQVSAAVDDAGNVTFVWNDYVSTGPFSAKTSLHSVQRRASDGAFVSRQLLEQPPQGTAAGLPVVHVTAAGRAVLTYELSSPGPVEGRVAFRDTAIGKFGPRTSEDNLNTPLKGAIDEAGASAILYQQSGAVKVRRRPVGGVLGPPITVDPSAPVTTALIALDAHARPTVAWVANSNGAEKLVACRVTAAGCATSPKTIDSAAPALVPLSLAEAPSGAAILTWNRLTGGPQHNTVVASARTAGHAFRPPRVLGAHDASQAIAGIDDAGDGLVSWLQDLADGTHLRYSGFDPNRPRITKLSVPATGQAGKTIHFSAKGSDVWGPVRFHWRFGDGTGASGRKVKHAYPTRGKRTVTVMATDAAGNTRTKSRTIRITKP